MIAVKHKHAELIWNFPLLMQKVTDEIEKPGRHFGHYQSIIYLSIHGGGFLKLLISLVYHDSMR